MEDVNMSQNAEQAAIDNVPPAGQVGVKRQVSADAFRALTMRLNGQKKQENIPVPAVTTPVPPSPPINPVSLDPVPNVEIPVTQPVEEPTVAAVEQAPVYAVPDIEEPVMEPVVNVQVAAEQAVPSIIEPAAAIVELPQPEPVVEQPPAQVLVETQQIETVPAQPVLSEFAPLPELATQIDAVPPHIADTVAVTTPVIPVVVAPVESAIDVAIEVPTIEPMPPETVPVEVKPANNLVDEVTQQVTSNQPPAMMMPAGGTKIILNPQAKPLTVAKTPLVSDVAAVVAEAIQPGSDTGIENKPPVSHGTAPIVEPLVQTLNPLQAAINLMNASGLSDSSELAPPAIIPAVPETPLSETKVEALSQEHEVPESNQSAKAEKVTAADLKDARVVKAKPKQRLPSENSATKRSPPVIGDAHEHVLPQEPDVKSGETARSLLDIMSSGSQPQERALAADTLLQLVPRMMVKDLVALAERVCMMEDAPPLLVKSLITHDEPRVASPLLVDGKVINEQDLLRLIATTDVDRLVMMAKHRKVTQTVCDALIARGEPSVYLTLVRNPGAELSHDAFVAFSEIAKSQFSLQAPLATRGDTPPPIAFELFWSLPVELRRYVLSRFLTDSVTLDKILKITQSVEGGSGGEQKFPPSRKVDEMIDLIADGVTDQAVAMMAKLAGTNQDNARRIIADPDGEPLTVVLKTMGQTRAQFSQGIKKCASSSKSMLRSDRDLSELQVMFDSLSFNKARTLLTYWDWAVEKTGPYTRRVM